MKNSLSTMSILILMIVIVCAVLGALSTATAYSDLSRAQKQADYVTAMQSCNNQAQDWLFETGNSAKEGSFEKEFTDGEGHSLSVEIQKTGGEIKILRWQTSTEWTDEKALGSLVHIN